MKKIIAIAAAVLMITALLAACSLSGDIGQSINEALEKSSIAPNNQVGDFNPEAAKIDGGGGIDEVIAPKKWTVLMYMCGSDLETVNELGTYNIKEIASAMQSDDINFIVQTGGAKTWHNDIVDPTKNQRFSISPTGVELVYEEEMTSMGHPDTLSSFLKWGAENYPAEKTMLIFWGHGAGPILGVEQDENFNNDMLTPVELEEVFSDFNPDRDPSKTFELIGFDTCLMGSLEMANLLEPYGKYMVSSEEIEPGAGWDYASWLPILTNNLDTTGDALGSAICDTYLLGSQTSQYSAITTLSCVDLSKIPQLKQEFSVLANKLLVSQDNPSANVDVVRGASNSEKYGGNSKEEGYTNMVDLGHLTENLKGQLSDGGQGLINALEAAVVHKINGGKREFSSGLSLYYPVEISALRRTAYVFIKGYCDTFGVEDYSLYLHNLIDREYTAGGELVAEGTPETVSAAPQINTDGTPTSVPTVDQQAANATPEPSPTDEPMQETYIALDVTPNVDENGVYNMTINPSYMEEIKNIYLCFYMNVDGDLMSLGRDNELIIDWSTGYVASTFKGNWLSMNGRYVSFEIFEQTDDYIIYTIPIVLNGENSNLRVTWSKMPDENGEHAVSYDVMGAWDGMTDTGAASRIIRPLQDGDEIAARLQGFKQLDDPEHPFIDDPVNVVEKMGTTMTVDENFKVDVNPLVVGDYLYGFYVEDVGGGTAVTDFAVLSVTDDGAMTITGWAYEADAGVEADATATADAETETDTDV